MNQPDFDSIKTADPKAIFSVTEAAQMLGVSHNGILMRIKRGTMRAGKSGGRWFLTGAEIQKSVTVPETYDI